MIIKKFEEQVERFAERSAVKTDRKELTYFELNREANRVGFEISKYDQHHDHGDKKDTVALLFEHGAEMIVGLLGVLKAGKIYVPLDFSYPPGRLSYMLEHSETSLIVTDNRNIALAEKLVQLTGKEIKIINVDSISSAGPGENLDRDPDDEKLAYILYTSGSTGKPKGVIQNHRNVLYYIKNWTERFSITHQDRLSFVTAFSHDGAGQDIFGALLNGAALYPLNVKALTDISDISQWLVRGKITVWHSVPTLFRYFAGTLTGSEKFAALRYVVLGGETLREHDLDLFRRFYPGAKLANVYGQTESSVNSIWTVDSGESYERVYIGEPLDETEIFVINKNGEILEDLGVGEILVASDYIAPGYWKDTQHNDTVFGHDPEFGKLYFTGDMGRIFPNGKIEIKGRIDSQIKIRGFRVEPGEIETTLLKSEMIKEVIVVPREDENQDKYLCAYLVLKGDSTADLSEFRDYLSLHLPDYMIPAYFVRMDRLPLTPSNKVDRRALPEPDEMDTVKRRYVAPRNEVEEKLTAIWAADLKIEPESIGIESSYFELGGHSLRATFLVGRICKEMDVRVPLAQIFRTPTIRGLAEFIKGAGVEKIVPIEKAPASEYYPLSMAQKRLFILQMMDIYNVSYNMPKVLLIEGDVDVEKIEETFSRLIEKHEVLRTSFWLVNGEPLQKVHDSISFNIERFHTTGDTARRKSPADEAEIIDRFIRPFDLSQPPLLRVGLICADRSRHILLVDMHHIITDGISNQLFVKDFISLYDGNELSPLRIQYKDYAVFKNRLLDSDKIREQEKYWLDTFAGDIPVLDLPLDYPRPAEQSHEGKVFNFKIDRELRKGIRQMERVSGATLFMILLSIYNILLMKYSGQEDVVVGTVTAGRSHPELENVVGVFINTLAIRNRPIREKRCRDFLRDVRENCLKIFENSDYQFEALLEKIKVERVLNRNPLFDTMLLLQNYERPEISSNGLIFKPYTFERKASIFDLRLTMLEARDEIFVEVEYTSSLFKPESIARLAGHYLNITREFLADADKRLGELESASEREREQILNEFNDNRHEYPGHLRIEQSVEEQAERTPDRVAVIWRDHLYTYRELSVRFADLARMLTVEYGRMSGEIVGIYTSRTFDMVVAILGVLKAGAVCLPFDPRFPQGRVNLILEDSHPRVLLKSADQDLIVDLKWTVTEFEAERLDRSGRQTAQTIGGSEVPAYVIYTSGSTGRPKGVLLEHRGIVNHLFAIIKELDIKPTDILCHNVSISYVVGIWQVFGPFMQGGRLVLYSEDLITNPYELFRRVSDDKVCLLEVVPSFLLSYLRLLQGGKEKIGLDYLRMLILTGEKVETPLVEEFYRYYDVELMNAYGQSENSDDTLYYRIPRAVETRNVPVGKPSHNTGVFVLGLGMQIEPVGVQGELHVSGDGLAAGYLNRPELTACKFFYHPSSMIGKIFSTGDLVRWFPGGDIEFLGRMDHQVKLRGHRIELSEIESRLLDHPGIDEAVVIVNQDDDGDSYLYAYCVADESYLVKDDFENGDEGSCQVSLNVTELREFLSRHLPDYMIPLNFVFVRRIPLTASGKIDRKSLGKLETLRLRTEKIYLEPETGMERMVAAMWGEILKIEKVGVEDNFFDLGGNSFYIVKMYSKLAKGLSMDIPLVELFRYPTVRTLSRYLSQHVGGDRLLSLERN